MISASLSSQAPDNWVYLASATTILLVFLAGLAVGPMVKSYEALFLEQRQHRRRLQQAAHACMNRLSRKDARTFNIPLPDHVTQAADEFKSLYWQEGLEYRLNPTDRTVGFSFITSVTAIAFAKTELEYLERRQDAYQCFLDFQRPFRRWRRRRERTRRMLPPIRKSNFTTLEKPEEPSQ